MFMVMTMIIIMIVIMIVIMVMIMIVILIMIMTICHGVHCKTKRTRHTMCYACQEYASFADAL
jgi:uncharacterized membrane protein